MKYVKNLNLFHNTLKGNISERGRLLGLNVGDKYVGLAVSNTNDKIASPLRQRRNTPDSEQVKQFIDKMSKIGKLEGLEYTYWDKEFISKDVELFLKNFSLPQLERKEMEYKFIAVELLQVTSLLSLL
ncbi:hypothetical protein Patl1_19368 [Pistacia atlantica]|uniref:Uncharacterized protein n=1 Tax=Pistacia atlantica TaxID=434234 RepID=A0ACC1C1U5_9ROSI|nr:hypothetical protein Patl1_19368 [Pistacia atlantica]